MSTAAGDVVVAGATGFVGARLAAWLHRQGVPLRCGSRDPGRGARRWPGYRWVRFDVDDPSSLDEALRGARALVYLVHHMAEAPEDLVAREAQAAARVVRACDAAGVGRIVYLGAPAPPDNTSEHLEARRRTGEVLASGRARVVELRASMIVGAGSESWMIVRDLALRLPVMVLPSWLKTRTSPLWIDDVVRALALAVDVPDGDAGVYDLPGPEVLAAREILERVAACHGLRPVMIPLGVLTPTVSSLWLRLVTRADWEVAKRLVKGLTTELTPGGRSFWDVVGVGPETSFDRAVERTLAEDVPEGLAGRVWERVARAVSRRA